MSYRGDAGARVPCPHARTTPAAAAGWLPGNTGTRLGAQMHEEMVVTGQPPSIVLDALADAPLGDVFALYAAVRGRSRRREVPEGAGT